VRETVSDQDLADVSAKQKLATIKERPGYTEAMTVPVPTSIARAFVLTAARRGGIMYACKLYVTAAWLMWILLVLFGLMTLGFLLAAIGFSPKLTGEKWGTAVLDKQDDARVKFLRDNGDEHVLAVTEQTYRLLRAGDVGVLHVTGSAPDYTVDSFTRL
jgi:hypothetical protein